METEVDMAGKDEDRLKIVDVLNVDRADELGAIMQYMGHHYEATGMESTAVTGIFRQTAMDEMRHAEMLAQRIVYLGGVPVQKAAASKRGGELKAMVNDDLDAENEAIGRYKEHIKLCSDLGDSTTRRMLEDILADEEAHADAWETVLGIRK
jgi:bacterioferritin